LGIECAREVLVNKLGHTDVKDIEVKGQLAFWILREATEKQILVMMIKGWIPLGYIDRDMPDSLIQDFKDMLIINETMLTNRNWDYERMKQFIYDNCKINTSNFNEVVMEDFQEEIIELIDVVEQDEIIKITEPESVTHGELPIKMRNTAKKVAAWVGSIGFILIVAGLFYNSKKE
jgi:predicted regulator of Ras-like GTPase activity (Roadblock/LC7/MglB family)